MMESNRVTARVAVAMVGSEHAHGLLGFQCRQFRACAILLVCFSPPESSGCCDVSKEEFLRPLGFPGARLNGLSNFLLSRLSDFLFISRLAVVKLLLFPS